MHIIAGSRPWANGMNYKFDTFRQFGLAMALAIFSVSVAAETFEGELNSTFPHETQTAERNVDPLERMNRAVFAFNDVLDTYFLAPVAETYHFLAPGFVEQGVKNFFSNLGELNDLVNHSLQGEMSMAAEDGGRFLVNSTIGVFGLVDVASEMGLDSEQADFGQTLARWGAGSGPYIMVPVLGPATVRSGVGRIFDANALSYQQLEDVQTRNGLTALDTVSSRADLLEAGELISGDRYIFLRDAYLQQREYITTGEIQDDFGDENFDWDD